jgi:para-aminobenzoate synthetase component 1
MYSINIDGSSIIQIKHFLVDYAKRFDLSIILDSNSHIFSHGDQLYKTYDLIAGFAYKQDVSEIITSFEGMISIDQSLDHWYLGYFTYDIKNHIEALHSKNPAHFKWPEVLFFNPSILILISNNRLEIQINAGKITPENILKELHSFRMHPQSVEPIRLRLRINKEEYLFRAEKIMEHIKRGDIYELNYCQEFYSNQSIDPYNTYLFINQNSPSPFSAFLKVGNLFLLSASPERFLKKVDSKIISQPMKGTAPRNKVKQEDDRNRNYLQSSRKEKAENIMITDLVRNDLSKLALKNSVKVEELCGIYDFPHVFQMISSVSATIGPITLGEIVKATFPMGSMTGAPKISAMQLIDSYETVRRELYSGSVGYIAPGMDFDFNVVIRSLQYNNDTEYLSYMAGGALTALSDPEMEYKECLLKSYVIHPVPQSIQYA